MRQVTSLCILVLLVMTAALAQNCEEVYGPDATKQSAADTALQVGALGGVIAASAATGGGPAYSVGQIGSDIVWANASKQNNREWANRDKYNACVAARNESQRTAADTLARTGASGVVIQSSSTGVTAAAQGPIIGTAEERMKAQDTSLAAAELAARTGRTIQGQALPWGVIGKTDAGAEQAKAWGCSGCTSK